MAPEQVSGQGYGFAVDYWSLGILLFAMLHVETPFASDTTETQVLQRKVSWYNVHVRNFRVIPHQPTLQHNLTPNALLSHNRLSHRSDIQQAHLMTIHDMCKL